jgi:hypothetical protein
MSARITFLMLIKFNVLEILLLFVPMYIICTPCFYFIFLEFQVVYYSIFTTSVLLDKQSQLVTFNSHCSQKVKHAVETSK